MSPTPSPSESVVSDASFGNASALSPTPSLSVSAASRGSLGNASELSPTPSLSVSAVSKGSFGKASSESTTPSPSVSNCPTTNATTSESMPEPSPSPLTTSSGNSRLSKAKAAVYAPEATKKSGPISACSAAITEGMSSCKTAAPSAPEANTPKSGASKASTDRSVPAPSSDMRSPSIDCCGVDTSMVDPSLVHSTSNENCSSRSPPS